MANKYGKAAFDAVKIIHEDPNTNPVIAWGTALAKYCQVNSESWKKSCPRGTFLGLCEEGRIIDIPAGNYTESIKNKNYGLRALELLKRNPFLANNKSLLWSKVLEPELIAPNDQMDIVVALWNEGLLK